MGKLSFFRGSTRNGILNCCMLKRSSMEVMSNENMGVHNEGIKTVRTSSHCDFSKDTSDLCICLVTWNMNGQVSYEDLVEIVGSRRKFDLLVVGLQEVPRNNISRMLQSAVAESHTLLGKAVMQSLQLYVFGPKSRELYARDLKVDKHSIAGFGGLIRRKKGAVAIQINFKGVRMMFISCHLSAHAHNVEERNHECSHITHSLFSKDWNPFERPAQVSIWLGDLNYRLQGIENEPARNLIEKGLHRMLISKDQLLQEAERGEIFGGYSEGTLKFKPTYKYDIGSTDYNSSTKVRVPSWTDRILFKVEDVENIGATLHCYESLDDIESSDHKPVKAHLCLRLNKEERVQ